MAYSFENTNLATVSQLDVTVSEKYIVLNVNTTAIKLKVSMESFESRKWFIAKCIP